MLDINLYKLFPPKNPGLVALQKLKQLGFSMPHIRKALIYLHGFRMMDMGKGEVGFANISKTISGITSNNSRAKASIAKKLNIPEKELFGDAK